MPLRNFLVIMVVAVISFACYSVTAKNRYANLFAEVMEIVNTEALTEVPKEKLFSDAMSGMLKELDEHCTFISDSGFREFKEDMQQEFGGVGMYVGMEPESETLMVLAPMPNTPAYEAGIQVGDLIISIAGEPTAGKTRSDAVKELRGPVGETVSLKIQRGDDTLLKTLTRAKIPIESAHGGSRNPDGSWNFVLKDHPEIGYIRLSQFGEMTGDEMRAALQSLPDDVEGLIVDLRANPGGLLDVAVKICDMFMEPGLPIVRIKGRGKELVHEYRSTAGTELPVNLISKYDRQEHPVCILIDRYSASASEIVSGCLQDHGRAVLIGEQSYGKGTVQDIIPIQRNKSLLKLTTASYWRPSDRQIDRHDPEAQRTKIWGVQPDDGFAIEMSDEELIANLQQRNSLDLSGLVPAAKDKPSETNDDDQPPRDGGPLKAAPSEGLTGDEPAAGDVSSVDSPSPELKVPHVDRPLEKAIEFIQSQESSLQKSNSQKKAIKKSAT